MRIVDLTTQEVLAVAKDLIKKGKFSNQPVTLEVQKEALRCLVKAYESDSLFDDDDDWLCYTD